MKQVVILLLITMVGCGSRKVVINKDSVKTTEEKQITLVDTTLTKTNTVNILDDFTIEPISDTIPMIINGKTYFNARLMYKKTSSVTNVVEQKRVSENVYIKVKSKTEDVKKEVEKKEPIFIFVIILVAIFVVIKFKLL